MWHTRYKACVSEESSRKCFLTEAINLLCLEAILASIHMRYHTPHRDRKASPQQDEVIVSVKDSTVRSLSKHASPVIKDVAKSLSAK